MGDLSRLGRNRFVILGRAGMDLYADPPGRRVDESHRYVAALGGSSANIGVAIVRQGGQAALVTRVSEDAVGRFVLNELDRYGIDRRHVRPVGGEARTSLAVVETRIEDHQSVIYRNGAADFALTRDDVAAVDYAGFAGLIVTGTALAAEPSRGATFHALDLARAAGLPLILDLDYRPYSWPSAAAAAEACGRAAALCDIVVGNDLEFDLLAPGRGLDAARALARSGVQVVIHKMGERGAVTIGQGSEFGSGIYEVAAIKPTGAGDAFLGGLVSALAQGRDLKEAVLRGSACAAVVVSRVGCAPAMPTGAELQSFLASHPGPTRA